MGAHALVWRSAEARRPDHTPKPVMARPDERVVRYAGFRRQKLFFSFIPAWRACGSYYVFVAQAHAYRALGARVISLAISDFPGFSAKSGAAKAYIDATQDLTGRPPLVHRNAGRSHRHVGVLPRRACMAAWRLWRDADRDRLPVVTAGGAARRENRSHPLQSLLLHSARRPAARPIRMSAAA